MNDAANAIMLAKKKQKILKSRNYDEKKMRLKLLTFLAGKGYDFTTSKDAVDKVMLSSDEEE